MKKDRFEPEVSISAEIKKLDQEEELRNELRKIKEDIERLRTSQNSIDVKNLALKPQETQDLIMEKLHEHRQKIDKLFKRESEILGLLEGKRGK